MAQQNHEIEFVEVKAEDIMSERQGLYDAFMASIPWAVGATVAILVLIYLIWG